MAKVPNLIADTTEGRFEARKIKETMCEVA